MAKNDKLNAARPIEDDFDLPEFDFDSLDAKDDRKPATKILHGAGRGVKATITDTSFIKKMLRTVLPEGYGMAMDFSSEVATSARQLYNNAAKEIKPSIAEMSKAADKLTPASAPYLKNTLSSINKWADDQKAKSFSSDDKDDQRTAGIGLSLSETFRFQMTENARSEARKETRSRLQEGIELHRHRDVFSMLNKISQSTSRLSQYQDKITINFQRKSLETQMRTQFLMMDLLSETKAQNAFFKTSLGAIQHNTGLPDFVKLTESERLEGMMRTKVAEKLFNSSAMAKLTGHIHKLAKEKVSVFKDAIRSGTDMINDANEAKSAMVDNDDKLGTGAEAASSLLVQQLGEYIGKKKAAVLAKNKNVSIGNEKLQDLILNLGSHLTAFKNSEKGKYDFSVKGKIFNVLRELVPNMGVDGGVTKDSIGDLNKPYIYTKQTHKSINEVIPGYLARIFREIQVLRTGDEKIGLTMYDPGKNKFLDSKTAAKNAVGRIISASDKESTTKRLDNMLNLVDPDKRMTPEARKALGKKLLKMRLNGEHDGMSSMTDYRTFSGDENTASHADELHGAMIKHFGDSGKPGLDENKLKKQNEFTSHHRNLGRDLDNSKAKVQEMINLGMYDLIESSGLLNEYGDAVDIEKLLSYAGGVGEIKFKEEGVVPGNKPSLNKPKKTTAQRGRHHASIKARGPAVQQKQQTPTDSTGMHQLNKTIGEHSTKDEAGKTVTLLERIEKHVADGNVDQAGYFSALIDKLSNLNTGHPGVVNKAADFAKTASDKIYSNGGVNLKNFAKAFSAKTAKGFAGARKIASRAAGTASDIAGGILAIGGGTIGGTLKYAGSKIKDRLTEVRDLYVPGLRGPVIKAHLMKAGEYIDVNTGKVIKSLKDITGQVKDKLGNVVLEKDQIKDSFTKGVLDNVAVKAGLNIFKRVKDTVTDFVPTIIDTGLSVAKKILDFGKDLLDQPIDIYVKGVELPVMTSFIMRNGGYFDFETGKPVTRPSHIKGAVKDESGNVVLTMDQIRAGVFDKNWVPIRGPIDKILHFAKKRLAGGANFIRKTAATVKKTIKSVLGGVGRFMRGGLGAIGGDGTGSEESIDLLSKIYQVLNDRLPSSKKKSAFNDKDADGQRDGSWRSQKKQTGRHDAAAKAKDLGVTAKKAAEGDGIIGSLIDVLKGLFSAKGALGKVLGLGRGLIGAGAAALPMLASAGGMLASGVGAAATGIGAVASFAGTALVGTLGVLGSILSSPVVLGALAVGGVAYGGYKLYKYLNSKPSALVAFRMVQYGFRQDDSKGIEKVLKLEELLKKITIVKAGRASIADKNFDEEQALALFNVSKDDSTALNNWVSWFVGRFKPVYLTHYTAIAAIDNKTPLEDVDSFKPAIKVRYLELSHFPEGPYDVSGNPDTTSDVKMTNGSDVQAAFKVAKAAADGELKKMKSNTRLGVATAAQTGEAAVAAMDKKQAGAGDKNTKADGLGGAAAAASDAQNITVSGAKPTFRKSGVVESIEGARFRTYGLITMESEKVNGLRQLEDVVIQFVSYSGDGKAVYKGDTASIMDNVGMIFGVAADTEAGNNWMNWFQKRFLPVYLTYLGLVKQMSGGELKKGRLPALKPNQQVTLTNQVTAVPGVWEITTSPWNNYVLGTDSSVIKPILGALQDAAKSDLAAEALQAKNTPAPNTSNKPVLPKPEDTGKVGNNPSAYKAPESGGVDAENTDLNKKGSGAAGGSSFGANGLVLAGGAISDGRNAAQYMKLMPGVKMEGLNKAFRKNFDGMVEEYGKLTGKTTYVNSGARTFADQAALYAKDPAKAAKPGTSLHEYGLALDVASSTLDEMDKLGLMRKYGFTRPVGGEPWHMEAAGIQTNIDGFKKDPASATAAIAASIGKGGGGLGTVASAPKYVRDPVLAKKLLDASVSPAQVAKTDAPEIPNNRKVLDSLNKPSKATSSGPAMIQVGQSTTLADASSRGAPGSSGVDAEAAGAGIKPPTSSSRAPGPDKMTALKDTAPSSSGSYSLLPEGKGSTGWESQKDVILGASKLAGVDPKLTASVIAIESGFNPNAKASTSSAAGLGQFTEGTWKATLGKYGSKYGLDANASPMDPRANSLMTAEYIKENSKALQGLKPSLTGTDLYMAHFLGPGGAKKMLSSDPSSSAASVLPAAAKSNPNIFYNGNQPRTVSELYALLDSKVKNKLSEHGVPSEYFPTGGLGLKPGGSLEGIKKDTIAPDATVVKPGDSSRAPTGPIASSSSAPTSSSAAPGPGAAQRSFSSTVSPMGDVAGFTGKTTSQAQQNPNTDMTAAMGDVSGTLKKSLDVQTQMLTVLRSMLDKGGLSGGDKVSQDPQKTMVNGNDMKSDSTQSGQSGRVINKMVPVSMSRV